MYQITQTDIEHGYVFANVKCAFIPTPKCANMTFRAIGEPYKMDWVHTNELPPPEYRFCVLRNPWTRLLSGMGEYRRRRRWRWRSTTWRLLFEEFLENPAPFDEHLEPQLAYMHNYTFTHIFKFETLLDDALEFPYFQNNLDWIRANISMERAMISQHLDIQAVMAANRDLVDQIVAKYYARDYEMWLSPGDFINKKIL